MRTRFDVLRDAEMAVQQRARHYGRPEDNAKLIAARWSITLGFPVDPLKVPQAMIDVKMSRLQHDPHHNDTWADIAGYAAYGGEMAAVNEGSFPDDDGES